MDFGNNKTPIYLGILIFCFVFGIVAIYKYINLRPEFENFDVTRIGVLDGGRLKSEAKCFKTHEKISAMLNDLIAKIRIAEQEMKDSYAEIKKNSKLNLNAKNRELTKVESKWRSLSRKYTDEMQSIRNLDYKVTEITQSKLFSVLVIIAKSYKLDLILNKSTDDKLNVLYTAGDIDITDLVIQKMDELLPYINLEGLK